MLLTVIDADSEWVSQDAACSGGEWSSGLNTGLSSRQSVSVSVSVSELPTEVCRCKTASELQDERIIKIALRMPKLSSK